jgi:hypothetical protein
MKVPIRQREVAWHLVSHPEHLHHPTFIAEKLQCSRNSVKLALNKLGKRGGERYSIQIIRGTKLEVVSVHSGNLSRTLHQSTKDYGRISGFL